MSRKLLEQLAAGTFRRLTYSISHDIAQGEETITDINLLDIAIADTKNCVVEKMNKHHESQSGVDWEWWIRQPDGRFRRYAIQAKKLSPNDRYVRLNHKNSHGRQVALLLKYARLNRCTPLYCFYNHSISARSNKFWHCCRCRIRRAQFGCTVVHAAVVNSLIKHRPGFCEMHQRGRALPWRCLLCPTGEPTIRSDNRRLRINTTGAQAGRLGDIGADDSSGSETLYDEPPQLRARSEERNRKFSSKNLPQKLYKPSAGAPRRIAILDSAFIGG